MKLISSNFNLFVVKVGILGLVIGAVLGISILTTINTENAMSGDTLLSPVPTIEANAVEPLIELKATEVIPSPEPVFSPRASYEGKASIYSRTGCLGCSPTLTMANGQPLNDDALTVAFNDEPLGTMLKITNPNSGKTVIAMVTDTGGFKRHGRIIDVVPAVARAIDLKTDQILNIEVVN